MPESSLNVKEQLYSFNIHVYEKYSESFYQICSNVFEIFSEQFNVHGRTSRICYVPHLRCGGIKYTKNTSNESKGMTEFLFPRKKNHQRINIDYFFIDLTLQVVLIW
jgi:hypothetical protein